MQQEDPVYMAGSGYSVDEAIAITFNYFIVRSTQPS